MSSKAYLRFKVAIAFAQDLLDIQNQAQSGRGRRFQQEAVHRSCVVLSVAAWEGFVEHLLSEAVSALAPPQSTVTWAATHFNLIAADLAGRIVDFGTPNSENIQRLYRSSIGFDPWPTWSWHVPRRQWTPNDMRTRLNQWLKIRHSIAHGDDLPSNLQWIQDSQGRARLTRTLSKECMKFLDRLATQTEAGLKQHLSSHFGIANPWP